MRVTIEQLAKILPQYKSEDKQEELKQLLRYWFSFEENIDTFSKFFFPKYINGTVPDFHKEFYNILLKESNDAFASHRGSAKSTTVGLVYISWCIVNNAEPYIVYISQNHAKTVQFITPLRWEFKTNMWLRFVYGDLDPAKAREEMQRDREDCIDINNQRIEAVSFEKNMRGFKYKNMRPSLIICDDIEDDERVKNPLLREKDAQKLNKVIIPSLDINGRIKMIGTILHLDSLLSKKIKTYKGKIFRALLENGKPLWEQRFTPEKLEAIKKDIGSVAFQQEYMNDPVDNETAIISSELVRKSYDCNFNVTYEDMERVYLGVDFAFSDRVTADYSAFMDIGIKRGKKYILNIQWKKGLSINEQLDHVRNLHNTHNYYIIAFEENSIKSSTKDIRQLKLPIKMFWTGTRDEKDMTKTNKPSDIKSYSKINAINRLSVEFENNMWVIPYNTEKQQKDADRLLSELTSWALEDGKLVEMGAHPDAPISMLLVNEALNVPKTIIKFV